MKKFCVSVLVFLTLCAGAALAQESMPLTYVAEFKVGPSKLGAFVSKAKLFDPMLDKQMAAGNVLAYGVDVDMLHVPGVNNVAFWFESPNYTALSSVLAAMEEFEGANPQIMADLGTMTDLATHHDFIARTRIGNMKKPPEGTKPVQDFDMVRVKPGKMDEFLALVKKYDQPILEQLMADGVIYGYEVDTEAVHTTAPGMTWTIMMMPDLGAKDKVNAAFEEADKKLPETERNTIEKMYDDLIEPGSHRDSIATSVVFKTK